MFDWSGNGRLPGLPIARFCSIGFGGLPRDAI
jgi:hypothetical protein